MRCLNNMKKVLNYPSSKWSISEKIAYMIPTHKCYVEPFFGSGAVFFSKTQISPIETINDLNLDVVNLFKCIQKDASRLACLVATTPYSRDSYIAAYMEKERDPYDQALKFLIKCWQGMGYRANGDKVGWKCDAMGREKMYALWNWYNLPNNVIDVCERLRAVQIENCNALDLISRYDDKNTFMYLDPPYLYSTGVRHEYVHDMSKEEHENLLKKIVDCKANIMISGFDTNMYNNFLCDWNKVHICTHKANGKSQEECIWMNFKDNQMSIFDI